VLGEQLEVAARVEIRIDPVDLSQYLRGGS
jgi:hypothetical protein